MEDADFEDCGVPLESCLDKLETKVCSKVEEAKNEITRTLTFNDVQTKIRDKEHQNTMPSFRSLYKMKCLDLPLSLVLPQRNKSKFY